MKQETWDLIENEFYENPDIKAEPVSETEFDVAIAELGFSKVDEDYRQFVIRYGGAEVEPNPIYGLRKAPAEIRGHNTYLLKLKE